MTIYEGGGGMQMVLHNGASGILCMKCMLLHSCASRNLMAHPWLTVDGVPTEDGAFRAECHAYCRVGNHSICTPVFANAQ